MQKPQADNVGRRLTFNGKDSGCSNDLTAMAAGSKTKSCAQSGKHAKGLRGEGHKGKREGNQDGDMMSSGHWSNDSDSSASENIEDVSKPARKSPHGPGKPRPGGHSTRSERVKEWEEAIIDEIFGYEGGDDFDFFSLDYGHDPSIEKTTKKSGKVQPAVGKRQPQSERKGEGSRFAAISLQSLSNDSGDEWQF